MLLQGRTLGAYPKRLQLTAVVYASFDGSLHAVATAPDVIVTGGEGLKFVEAVCGRAAQFGEGDCVEYHKIPGLDPHVQDQQIHGNWAASVDR